MEEIQVEEYIRTSYGIIDKIINRDDENHFLDGENGIIIDLEDRIGTPISDIVKHSKNITDLIEKDDFVNGCRVYEVEEKGITVYQKVENSNIDYNWIAKDEIETILTKEQFENNCYTI